MNTNIISKKDYESYLKEIERLIELDPVEGTKDAKHLLLLSLAAETYEKNHIFFDKPTPIDAIKFRMEEMGLKQNDIAPYLGGKNRASEILSETRPLTLPMIKALNKYLRIPFEILLRDEGAIKFNPDSLSFDESIVGEMLKLGWLKNFRDKTMSSIREHIEHFLKPIGGLSDSNVLCRQSAHVNLRNRTNKAALFLWSAKLLIEAQLIDAEPFKQENITLDLLKELVHLSIFDEGPLLARELLRKNGIKLIILPHLSSTYLDGGVVMTKEGVPVVGLTLRYDRLDNFWHSLLHEMAHVYKHIKFLAGPFLDDSDYTDESDPIEKEADQIARDIAIPRATWKSSDVLQARTKESIITFAKELHIHPAIVAGRVRYETRNYTQFSDMLGSGVVSEIFKNGKA